MIRCRVDDFPGTKPDEFWKHNRDNYLKFHEILIQAFPTYVLGVIPRHTTDDDLKFLGALSEVEIALHGINHDERFMNEFREHQTQADIEFEIRNAVMRIPFHSRKMPFSYIPPHNVLDFKTINALKNCNISRIHTGPGTELEMIDYAEKLGLDVIDSRGALFYGRTDEMMERGCFPVIKQVSDISDVNLTLHWTWEMNIGLDSLRTFVGKLLENS